MANLPESGREVKLRLPGEEPMRYHCGQSASDVSTPGFVLARFNEAPRCYPIISVSTIELCGQSKAKSDEWLNLPELTPDSTYLNSLRELIAELNTTGGKTVISRMIADRTTLSADEIFSRLCSEYPDAAVAQWDDGGDTWLTATPELLLTADEASLQTMALAGTRPANYAEADWDKKNLIEQQMVTDYIMDILLAQGLKPAAEERTTLKAGPVEHICTRISAPRNQTDALKIATLLAPTPAVAGMPKELSLERIGRIERHSRGCYAGFFGFTDTHTSKFFVTLRCMRLTPSGDVYIYTGGGITADSNPEAEWRETCNKAATLLRVLR